MYGNDITKSTVGKILGGYPNVNPQQQAANAMQGRAKVKAAIENILGRMPEVESGSGTLTVKLKGSNYIKVPIKY